MARPFLDRNADWRLCATLLGIGIEIYDAFVTYREEVGGDGRANERVVPRVLADGQDAHGVVRGQRQGRLGVEVGRQDQQDDQGGPGTQQAAGGGRTDWRDVALRDVGERQQP